MKTIIFSLLLFTAATVSAQKETRVKHFNLKSGNVAIKGYDAVAYFTEGKAVEGNKNLAVSAEGVIYYFSTAANKALFLKDFRKYEPQYGGWCAYAMGENNEKVSVDPETFKILDGKLYLFYNSWGNNTLKKWNKNEPVLKTAADKNWQVIYR